MIENIREVGEFEAKAGEILAKLKLKSGTYYSGGSCGSANSVYLFEASFQAITHPEFPKNPSKVTYEWVSTEFRDLGKLKRVEEGIETLLAGEFPNDWRTQRSAITCILSLEKQLREFYSSKKKD